MQTRRKFIKQSTGAAISVFGASLPVASSFAQDRYAKYKGTTLLVSWPAHPHYDAATKLLPEFTKETGIKVEVDKLAVPRMKDKQLLEMAKPSGDYDLACYVVMWKGEYVKKNLIRELEPFFKNPALADPSYDMKDIIPGYLENIGLVGGPRGYLAGPGAKLYGLPYGAETSVLAYRRDIFEKHSLKPPTNYLEFEKLLPILRDKEGIGALTSRGQAGHQCVHAWLLHLNPLGGKVFDANWKPRFNDDIGVAALKFLKLVVDTGPAGIAGYGQGEMLTAFTQGQASMYLDSTIIAGVVNDPARSRVAGKVSYVVHPKGSRYASQSGGFGMAIPKNAKNPDAAFLLLQWLTSKAQDKAVCRLGGGPTRNSSLDDVNLVRQFPEYITFKEQLKHSEPDWRPIIAEWDEINIQSLGVAVSEALTGKKLPKEALDGIVPKVTDLMKRNGYIKT